jgi:hypothetical protein
MTRENVYAKANRYLSEHRLSIEAVDRHRIVASCRGSGALYVCGYDRGGWHCDCPSRGRCAHLTALQAVVIAPPIARKETQ